MLRGRDAVREHARLERWHGLPKGRELTGGQPDYVVDVICRWIDRRPAGD